MPFDFLHFVESLEDALLEHITSYGVLNATDPLICCAREFTGYIDQIKSSPEFFLFADANAVFLDKICHLQMFYAYQPAGLIRVSVRFLAGVAKCSPHKTFAYVESCLVLLARSTQSDIDLFHFTAEAEEICSEEGNLPVLLDEKTFSGHDYEHSLYIDCAGIRMVRGYYTRTNALHEPPYYVSTDGAYSITKVAIQHGEMSLPISYVWQITDRSVGFILYACNSDASSRCPSIDWLICESGASPAPSVFFVHNSRKTLTAAIFDFKAAEVSTPTKQKHPKLSHGERHHRRSLIPLLKEGQESPQGHLGSSWTGSPCRTAQIDLERPEKKMFELLLPSLEKSRNEIMSVLHNEIDEAHKKAAWLSIADSEEICVGHEEPFQFRDARTLPGVDFSRSWLLSNRLKKQMVEDTCSIANQCAQQLIGYKSIVMPYLNGANGNAPVANVLGVKLTGCKASPCVEYVIRYDVPQYPEFQGSLCDVIRLTQLSVEDIFSRARDETVSTDTSLGNPAEFECISMGFDEASEVNSNSVQVHLETFRRLDSCSQALNAATEEAISARVSMATRKSVTTRFDLSMIAYVHTKVSGLSDFMVDTALPQLPDLSVIRALEEELLRSTSDYDGSLCLSVSNLNDTTFAIDSKIPLNAKKLRSLQHCLHEIDRYLNELVAVLSEVDRKTNKGSELDCSQSTLAFAIASTLLANPDMPPESGTQAYGWRRSFFCAPQGLHIALSLNGTHKSLSLLLSDEDLLSEQDGLCKGCGDPIYGNSLFGYVKKRNYRRCAFTDALFCKQWCHKNDMHALPMNILWNLDETEYSVSRPAYAFLVELWSKPVIPVAKIHPDVMKRAPGIVAMQRERILIMKRMRSILRSKHSLHNGIETTIGLRRLYMCFTSDLFSFADLSPTTMLKTIDDLQMMLRTKL